jgi:hypothetical protein
MFQQTTPRYLAQGQVGEWAASDSPYRAAQARAVVSDPVVNKIGYAYTENGDGTVACGGTGAFLGIGMIPKEYASKGQALDPLAPTFEVPDGTTMTIGTDGAIFVYVDDDWEIGDQVLFAQATGAIAGLARGNAVIPVGYTLIPHATIDYQNVDASDLIAIIRLGRV